jgi:DNA modification methylase
MVINNSKLIKKLDWGRFVSPMSDRNIIPFNWYAFKHRFGSQLVSNVFPMFNLPKGSTVFDPFCGGGTTLIKAKIDGYNSVGLDISPFSVFLTNTLTRRFASDKLSETLRKISHRIDNRVEIPDVSILRKSFSDTTLKYIYSLKNHICSLDSPQKDFFLLALLSVLNNLSKVKKSGGFLRVTEQRKVSAETAKKEFIETSEKFISDLDDLKYTDSRSVAILGDARNYPAQIKNQRFDAILTSPPYPNRHDYTRIYELELLVGFIDDNQTLKDLRYNTLRSHVEAKEQYPINGYKKPVHLEKITSKLSKRELNNARIVDTINGYFEDMYLCLKEMTNVLKKNGHIGLVVSNVRFAGVMIPVDELLNEIGKQVGLKSQGIYVLRYRGNSPQQMVKYEKESTRESLIVWQKK